MATNQDWQETDSGFARGAARAELRPEVNAFVILTFGQGATADEAFECIVAAMCFGMIVIPGEADNQVLVKQLQRDGRVRFTPFVGLPFEAVGVMAVRTKPADAEG